MVDSEDSITFQNICMVLDVHCQLSKTHVFSAYYDDSTVSNFMVSNSRKAKLLNLLSAGCKFAR